MGPLYKISEGLALLDMLTAFVEHSALESYVCPEITSETLALKAGRHPICEKVQKETFIANGAYATHQGKRFQIITGCNMSGKSTYIRAIALNTILGQIGSCVPAEYASFPIISSVFARIATDACIEANVSTFAAEMREMAYILRSLQPQSLVLVDELGRGTSTSDGLALAIAICESLIQGQAFVYFVTHFRELPKILAERAGVFNMHMNVDIADDFSQMEMHYKVSEGCERQRYYGLALAQLVDIPEPAMNFAVEVSSELNDRNDDRRTQGETTVIALARKRNIAINLGESLMQAIDGILQGDELLTQMQKLQSEFLIRFNNIEIEEHAQPPVEMIEENDESELPGMVSDTSSHHRHSSHDNIPSGGGSISWEQSLTHQNPLF